MLSLINDSVEIFRVNIKAVEEGAGGNMLFIMDLPCRMFTTLYTALDIVL